MTATDTVPHLSQLRALEAEAVHIMREVAAQLERPVLLFSGGKDSIVLLRLAEKAFRPGAFPFPVLHVDTGHNFPEVLEYRDRRLREIGERLIVASVQDSIDTGRVAEETGPDASRNRLQTTTLLDAIAANGFDAAFGGARRDEERARAKERIFSFRDEHGQWDPRAQRPEVWNLYNGAVARGESVRVFPLSNWTELDVWRYIAEERLEIPSIYFAHEREVFERDGMLLAVSEWLEPRDGERGQDGLRALPHRGRHDDHRRRRVRCRRRRGGARGDRRHAHDRARPDPRRRSRVRGLDGGPQARGLLLSRSDLLRIATAGSVDDGKSTLIGRLLYDSKSLMSDQVADAEVDLAQMTDGLRAEREQGITIDVAYRYFATPRRSFIIADTPGHVRYTRNMVTGASTADLAVVLIDARNGVVEQSRRHACLSALLGLRHLVFAVNKMDLVDWDEGRFREIEAEALALAEQLEVPDAHVVPISALEGDNVVERSASARRYYDGPPLLELLETVEVARDRNLEDIRLPIQWVVRPRDAKPGEHRLYAGQVASGVIRAGDEITALPEGARTRIESVETADGPLDEAYPPMSVLVRLADDLDVGRGDLLASPAEAPPVARELEATVCWMADAPLRPGAKLRLKHTTRTVRATVEALLSRVDVLSFEEQPEPAQLELNDIGRVRLLTASPVMAEPYDRNQVTGAFVLVDELTRDTVAAGMVREAKQVESGMEAELAWEAPPLDRDERWEALGARGATVWLRGTPELLAEAGAAVERALVRAGRGAYLLDGGLSQQGLAPGRLARLFADSGAVAVVALPHAPAELRREARELHAAAGLDFEDLHIPDGEPSGRTAERVLEALEE